MDKRLATLEEIEAAIWDELARAAADRQHPWRVGVLATVACEDGEPLADARTVVTREVEVATHTLLIYTDARAGKAHQLQKHPIGTLVMWSPVLGWQLRCRVRLELEEDGLAVSSRWAYIRQTPGAHDYLSPLAPGSPLESPLTPRGGREHFAMISAAVESLDWLELHPDGQRRARFDASGRRWLQP